MTRLNRRDALGLLGAASLAGCAPAIQTAALGDDPFEGGIGGTGIVGVMVASGSVLINGMRVEVPDNTRIFSNGTATGDSVLVPGKAMTIVARARFDRLEAARIDVEDLLIGKLEQRGAALEVNGTTVRPDAGAAGTDLVGRRVAVSGVWQADGSVRASLIRVAPQPGDGLAGVVTGRAGTGLRIGQTLVRPPAGASLLSGQYTVVTGKYDGDALMADRVRQGRFRGTTGLEQLSVEGFLEPVDTAPGFRIAGLGHSFARQLDLAPLADSRSVFFGRYNGLFAARRALTLPNSVVQRRALLSPDEGASFATALSGQNARRIEDR